jgi:hypothetical protein
MTEHMVMALRHDRAARVTLLGHLPHLGEVGGHGRGELVDLG